jgi:large subunit ribosomal protein L25
MSIEFTAFPRNTEGRGASRRMRRAGKAPGIVYGGTAAPTPIELDHNALFHALRNETFHSSILMMKLDGSSSKVLLRDVQMHPFRNEILHVDFQRVDENKPIHMKVPLHFVNAEVSPAVKLHSAIISHVIAEVDIACLPKDLPEFIEVDLSELDVGHSIHVSSLKLPSGVTVVTRGAIRWLPLPSCRVRRSRPTKRTRLPPRPPRPPQRLLRPPQPTPRRATRKTTRRSNRGAGCKARGARTSLRAFFLRAARRNQLMPMPIRLVAGLGNPGREYANTRHNAGFWFADALGRTLGAHFATEGKFAGEVARAGDLRIVKPMTFMNLSGRSVAALARFFAIDATAILVVHDELDLKPGEAKLKFGGGHAGHNGLRDIHAQLGSPDYWRLRIGIGHPRDSEVPQQQVVDYVLKPPRGEEGALIEAALARAIAAWPSMAMGDMERAMMALHTRDKPATPEKTKDQQ